ncbi:hypothetical protein KCP71_12080 [Salmonella enterica subsp. enterica]|nr:hypothetical protein KCP71_12080 [Salmonella enterica subsp. enterica]
MEHVLKSMELLARYHQSAGRFQGRRCKKTAEMGRQYVGAIVAAAMVAQLWWPSCRGKARGGTGYPPMRWAKRLRKLPNVLKQLA